MMWNSNHAILFALLLGASVTACAEVGPSSRTVTVVDAEDGSPIAGAVIKLNISAGFGGTHQVELRSDAAGTASVSIRDLPDVSTGVWGVSSIHVTKHGYHLNGIAHAPERRRYRIGLREIRDPMAPIVIGNAHTTGMFVGGYRGYLHGDALDLLSLTKADRRYYAALSPVADEAEFDFRLAVNTTAQEPIRVGSAILEFSGQGGAQPVGDVSSGPRFAFENMFDAPLDGYHKRLQIRTGAAYFGRTRDGSRFFKFTTMITRCGNERCAKLQILLQPDESRNLESPRLVPKVAILEVDPTTVTLIRPGIDSRPIPSRVSVRNAGPAGSSLRFSVVPVSRNVRGLRKRLSRIPLESDAIVVYPSTGSVTGSSSLEIIGNAEGSFMIETGVGSVRIEVLPAPSKYSFEPESLDH